MAAPVAVPAVAASAVTALTAAPPAAPTEAGATTRSTHPLLRLLAGGDVGSGGRLLRALAVRDAAPLRAAHPIAAAAVAAASWGWDADGAKVSPASGATDAMGASGAERFAAALPRAACHVRITSAPSASDPLTAAHSGTPPSGTAPSGAAHDAPTRLAAAIDALPRSVTAVTMVVSSLDHTLCTEADHGERARRAVAAARALGPMPSLCRVVWAARGSGDNEALAALPPTLRVLEAGDSCLTDAAPFWRLRNLTELAVHRTRVGNAVLAALPPSLTVLNIHDTALTADARFDHLPALRVAVVAATAMSDDAIASLPPSLVELHCRRIPATPRVSFAHLPALRVLDASAVPLGAAAIASLPPSLHTLHVQYASGIDTHGAPRDMSFITSRVVSRPPGRGLSRKVALYETLPAARPAPPPAAPPVLTASASFAHLSALRVLHAQLELGTGAAASAVIATLPPSLRVLDLQSVRMTDPLTFHHLRALRRLSLAVTIEVADATLASLPPTLRQLHAPRQVSVRAPVNTATLAHLAVLRKLEVGGMVVGDAFLAALPASLVELRAAFTALSAAARFGHLRALHTLDVRGTQFGDAALASLPCCITYLDARRATYGAVAPDAARAPALTAAARFTHLRALRVLFVSHQGVGDAALASLPPSLTELDVDATALSAAARFYHLPALQKLRACFTGVGDAALASVQPCLRQLLLKTTALTPAARFDHLPALTVVCLPPAIMYDTLAGRALARELRRKAGGSGLWHID